MSKINKKTICVDFDGVINSYTSGWTWRDASGPIPDHPVEGAFPWLIEIIRHFKVCIYSSRSKVPRGIYWMKCWFIREGFPPGLLESMEFPSQKPAAHLTIDDRAFRFDGVFPTADEINNFKPWHKKEPSRLRVFQETHGNLEWMVKATYINGKARVDEVCWFYPKRRGE